MKGMTTEERSECRGSLRRTSWCLRLFLSWSYPTTYEAVRVTQSPAGSSSGSGAHIDCFLTLNVWRRGYSSVIDSVCGKLAMAVEVLN